MISEYAKELAKAVEAVEKGVATKSQKAHAERLAKLYFNSDDLPKLNAFPVITLTKTQYEHAVALIVDVLEVDFPDPKDIPTTHKGLYLELKAGRQVTVTPHLIKQAKWFGDTWTETPDAHGYQVWRNLLKKIERLGLMPEAGSTK